MSGQWKSNSNTGKEALRVALVDEDASLHHAVRRHFTGPEAGWYIDSYTDAAEALKAIHAWPPEIVLMERNVQGRCGIECTRKLKKRLPQLPVVMFTARADAGTLLSAMAAGAHGYLIKPMAPVELLPHLRKVMGGGTPFCPRAEQLLRVGMRGLGCQGDGFGLSRREEQVLQCLCRNLSDKEVAAALGIACLRVREI